MLGDVSSHGFPAAIIMASVLSAAGTHAAEGGSPEHTVRRVLESVIDELTKAEMHLALFFAVLDPAGGHICYSNAGHPHAFRVRPDGTTERLGATSPPLGLSDPEELSSTKVPWVPGEDRLVLFSDGISDAATESGERFGEERVLDVARSIPESSSGELLEAILGAMDAFGAIAGDDRTILVLRS